MDENNQQREWRIMEDWISNAESAIILGMNATSKYDPDRGYMNNTVSVIGEDGRKTKTSMLYSDVGGVLGFESFSPSSAFAANFGGERDDERIYTTSHEYLAAHPADIIKDNAEIMFFLEDIAAIRWIGLKRTKPKKTVYAMNGKASVWYEMHVRQECANGLSLYHQRMVPISADGRSLMAKSTIGGAVVCSKQESLFLTLAASIIEDNLRAKTMLARIKEDTEIKFAVPLDDYKEMFIGRSAPMQNGRRRAIIHWVASHLRKKKDGDSTKVKKHMRGVDEIEIDGLKISITPNDKIE